MNRQELRKLLLGAAFVLALVVALELLGRYAADAWARVNVYPDAAHPTYSITGSVKDRSGQPLLNFKVTDNHGRIATTNSNGVYTFWGLPADYYQVKVVKDGWVFTPATRAVTLPPSATGQSFVGVFIRHVYLPSVLKK